MKHTDVAAAIQAARIKRSFKLRVVLRRRPEEHLLKLIRGGVVTTEVSDKSRLEKSAEPEGSSPNRTYVVEMPDDFDENAFVPLAEHIERIEAV